MEDGLIDIDIVASLCTSATVYMAGLVGVLYVGHKIEKLCPFLLVVLGEKVGYLTVAAGVEQLLSFWLLGNRMEQHGKETLRGYLWDLDMLMHLLIMGGKLEWDTTSLLRRERERSKSSDLIAAPADGLAEDREGLAEETAVNAQRKKADEKVEEGNEDGSTTTTPTSSVARSKDLAAFFRFHRPLEAKPSLRRQILRRQIQWMGVGLRLVLSPRLDDFHQSTSYTYTYYLRYAIKHNLDRVVRTLLLWALRHPVAAKRLVGEVRTGVRILKDAIPVIGTANKFKGNVVRWVRLRRIRRRAVQRRAAAGRRFREVVKAHASPEELARSIIMKHVRRLRRERLLRRQREVDRAVKQDLKRRQQQRKSSSSSSSSGSSSPGSSSCSVLSSATGAQLEALLAGNLTHHMDEHSAAMKIQSSWRGYLAKVKVAIARVEHGSLHASEKLLIRPDSRFASIWAAVFVVTIVVEVIKLLTLAGGKKGNIEELFQRMAAAVGLVPDQCLAGNLNTKPKRGLLAVGVRLHRLARRGMRGIGGRSQGAGVSSSAVGGGSDVGGFESVPGFCSAAEGDGGDVVASGLILAMHGAALLVETAVFVVATLDVPIRFFIGELDEKNGTLVSKPFFRRWIVPGILIQLLVNPGLKPATNTLKWLFAHFHSAGPAGHARNVVWILPLLGWLGPRLHHEVYQYVSRCMRASRSSIFRTEAHPRKHLHVARAIEKGREAAKAKRSLIDQAQRRSRRPIRQDWKVLYETTM